MEVPQNSFYGIIGRSGAGKSTLVRLMSLLERPDSGEILFDGERADVLKSKALLAKRRSLGMVFQQFNLFSSRNVFDNVAYPLEIIGAKKESIAPRVRELLAWVDLSEKETSPVSRLSGGQKQRVAIARALANNPSLLFCDEPTSALDPQTTVSILELLKKIRKEMGLTVIMISHQMEVISATCNFVAELEQGAIVSVKELKHA